MPNTSKQPKKQVERDRRETIEALRKEEKRKERRKTLLFVGVAALLGIGLVAAAAIPAINDARNDPANRAWSEFGVSADAAACTPAEEVPVAGTMEHVEDGTRVDYDSAPAVSGKHYNQWALNSRKFYTRAEVPSEVPVERLVHNLEHGYAIVWYDSSVDGDTVTELEDLAARGAEEKATAGKFIVAPWPEDREAFPEGKTIAITRWGAEKGYRQYCGALNGDAIREFVNAHPYTDAPEPNGG